MLVQTSIMKVFQILFSKNTLDSRIIYPYLHINLHVGTQPSQNAIVEVHRLLEPACL